MTRPPNIVVSQSRTLSELRAWKRDLDDFRKQFCDAGWWPALFDAVEYCQKVSIPLPEWAAVAVLNLIQERHFEDGKAGGYGSAHGKFSMDYAHYLRWQAVGHALQTKGLVDLPAQQRPGRPKVTAYGKKAILEQAKEWLRDKPFGRGQSREQIEESFHIVTKSIKAGEARFRFDRQFTI
jgi:hypothetical protein